jgi:hypothetical protein
LASRCKYVVFNLAKEFLTFGFEDLANCATSDSIDFIVSIEKLPPQFVGNATTDSALSCTHQTD